MRPALASCSSHGSGNDLFSIRFVITPNRLDRCRCSSAEGAITVSFGQPIRSAELPLLAYSVEKLLNAAVFSRS